MVDEYSYGIVPLQQQAGEWYVLIIQHRAAGYWGFPKGHPEEGETDKETAIRELLEETDLQVTRFISDTQFTEQYTFTLKGKRIRKQVAFFIAEVSGIFKLQVGEVRAARWIPLREADQYVTYEADKSICREANKILELQGQ